MHKKQREIEMGKAGEVPGPLGDGATLQLLLPLVPSKPLNLWDDNEAL